MPATEAPPSQSRVRPAPTGPQATKNPPFFAAGFFVCSGSAYFSRSSIAARSSRSSASVASIRERLNASIGRPCTISY